MRRPMGALLATGLLVSMGMLGAPPASAAGGTSCKSTNGTATFTPALPKLGLSTKVFAKISVSGVIITCTGGGVTSGSVKITTKPKSASNCATLAAYDSTPTTGTEVITWNTGATSTIAVKLIDVKNQPTQLRLQGTVTSGLFKGMKQNVLTQYAVPKGGCVTTGLSTVTYKALGTTTIR